MAVPAPPVPQVNSSFRTVLRNNTFRDGLSRLGPVNSPHSLVTGNTFDGASGFGGPLSASGGTQGIFSARPGQGFPQARPLWLRSQPCLASAAVI